MRRGQKTSAEPVVLKLRQIEVQTAQGKSLALACKEAENSQQSYYRWRKEYGDLQVNQARKMKELERENARLRRLVADLSLVGQVLADEDALTRAVIAVASEYGRYGYRRVTARLQADG
jgi:putative transposase